MIGVKNYVLLLFLFISFANNACFYARRYDWHLENLVGGGVYGCKKYAGVSNI